jgi:hypothetical protein
MIDNSRKWIFVFALCNAALILLTGAVWVSPVYASFTRTREAVRLQESRLAIYRQAGETSGGHVNKGEAPGIVLIPYGETAKALAEIAGISEGLGLREVSFSAGEPMERDHDGRGSRVFFEVRVSASYEGDTGGMAAFTQALGHGQVQAVHIDLNRDAPAMRVAFSFFTVK